MRGFGRDFEVSDAVGCPLVDDRSAMLESELVEASVQWGRS
jgi:hypothetical protein